MGPNSNDWCSYKTGEDTQRHGEEGHVEMGGRDLHGMAASQGP